MGLPALYLSKGALNPAPAANEKAIVVDTDNQIKVVESTGAKTFITGGWALVERKVITADVQSYTFAGLNGDVDEAYQIIADVKGGVGSAGGLLSVRPNNLSTNASASGISSDNGGAPAGEARAELTLGLVPVANRLSMAVGTFFAKTGSDRAMVSQCTVASIQRTVTYGSRWTDTAVNVTSIVLFSADATGLGIGTVLTLSKRVVPG